MISIHDNEVQAYTVDLKNKTIRLDTTWSYKMEFIPLEVA